MSIKNIYVCDLCHNESNDPKFITGNKDIWIDHYDAVRIVLIGSTLEVCNKCFLSMAKSATKELENKIKESK